METFLGKWEITSAENIKNVLTELGKLHPHSALSLHFYPNVTTLRSGLCCRKSVCLSVVCRLSVCNVGAPYSGG